LTPKQILSKGRCVTTVYTDLDIPAGTEGVYAPQEDSQLLVDIMEKAGLALWNSGRAT
jgi:hypothetical protein